MLFTDKISNKKISEKWTYKLLKKYGNGIIRSFWQVSSSRHLSINVTGEVSKTSFSISSLNVSQTILSCSNYLRFCESTLPTKYFFIKVEFFPLQFLSRLLSFKVLKRFFIPISSNEKDGKLKSRLKKFVSTFFTN